MVTFASMNEFPKFFNERFLDYYCAKGAKPRYAILGVREWRYLEEYINYLDSIQAIRKDGRLSLGKNPTFQEIQLLKSYEESVIIFVP